MSYEQHTRVPCEDCGGTGQRKLTHTERVTLTIVDDEWRSTAALLAKLGGKVKLTAFCNRLASIKRLRLVESRESETNHRVKEWRRIP